MAVGDDLDALSSTLREVQTSARSLPWNRERPWRVRSHLGTSNGLPMVDLHDLSVRLGLDVVDRTLATELSTGGVIFITGRGKHTAGRSTLRDAVLGRLEEREQEFRPLGPGRVEVILDGERVRKARPGMGLVFWLLVALVIAGLGIAILNRL